MSDSLQYSLQPHGLQHARPPCPSLEKTLMLGKTTGRSRRGQQRMRWLDSITNSMDMRWSKRRKIVKDRKAWLAAVHGVPKSQTWLNNWTTTKIMPMLSWNWQSNVKLFQGTRFLERFYLQKEITGLTQIGFIESFCRLFSDVFLSVLENILHFYKLAVHIGDNVTDIFA